MPETDQALLLDLPNPLPGDAHKRPDFFEGHRLLIVQAEVQPETLGLPFLERRKRAFHTVLEGVGVRLILGRRCILIGQIVKQPVSFSRRERSVQ